MEYIKGNPIIIRDLSDIKPEAHYDLGEKIIFSPLVTGNGHIRCAVTEGQYNTESKDHTHLGDAIFLTLSGAARIKAGGEKYILSSHLAICVPPEQIHSLVVTSKEPWISVAFFCEDCPLLKKEMETKRRSD